MTRYLSTASAFMLTWLIVLAAFTNRIALLAAILLVVVAIAIGWPGMLALPTQRGSTSMIAIGGASTVTMVIFTAKEPILRNLPIVIAISFIGMFWHQLLRRDSRPRIIDSITGVVFGMVISQFATGWLVTVPGQLSRHVVLLGAVSCSITMVLLLLPLNRKIVLAIAAAASALAALGVAMLFELPVFMAASSGAIIAAVAWSLYHLLRTLPAANTKQAAVTIGAAIVATSGIVLFTTGRLFIT